MVAGPAVGAAHEGVECAARPEVEGADFGDPRLRAPPLLQDRGIAPGPPDLLARRIDETVDDEIELRVSHCRGSPTIDPCDRTALPRGHAVRRARLRQRQAAGD